MSFTLLLVGLDFGLFFFFLFLVSLEQFSSVKNKSGASNTSTGSPPPYLTLEPYTEYNQYTDEFQRVSIAVYVGKPNGITLLNLEHRDPNGKLVENISRQIVGYNTNFTIYPGEIGNHTIDIRAMQNGHVAKAFTTYNVVFSSFLTVAPANIRCVCISQVLMLLQ